jgi:hypothetical protein
LARPADWQAYIRKEERKMPEDHPAKPEVIAIKIEDTLKGGSTKPLRPPTRTLRSVHAHLNDSPECRKKEVVEMCLREIIAAQQKALKPGDRPIDAMKVVLHISKSHYDGENTPLGIAEWWPKGHSLAMDNEKNIADKASYVTSIISIDLPETPAEVVRRLKPSIRREIFTKLLLQSDQAKREVEAMDVAGGFEAKEAEIDRRRELGKAAIQKKYRVTDKDIEKINNEGMLEHWPFPKNK